MSSDGCSQASAFISCRDAHLQVSVPGIEQQLIELPEIRFPSGDASAEGSFSAAAFRGDLVRYFGNGMYGIMVTELNQDRIPDLVVWTGNAGHGGDPSYTWFISDRNTGKLVENTEMAELMTGHSLSWVDLNHVHAWYRNDQCIRGDKIINIYDDGPRVVKRHDYDDCKAPTGATTTEH